MICVYVYAYIHYSHGTTHMCIYVHMYHLSMHTYHMHVTDGDLRDLPLQSLDFLRLFS